MSRTASYALVTTLSNAALGTDGSHRSPDAAARPVRRTTTRAVIGSDVAARGIGWSNVSDAQSQRPLLGTEAINVKDAGIFERTGPLCMVAALATALHVGGCSSQQLYDAGQSIGRSRADCEAIISVPERERCSASFERSHAEYERQRRDTSR